MCDPHQVSDANALLSSCKMLLYSEYDSATAQHLHVLSAGTLLQKQP
jgi:hypothetical protein